MSASSKADASILTFLRIRPSKNPSGFFGKDDLEPNSLSITLPDDFRSADYVNNTKLRYAFHFNGILDMKNSQEDVFSKVGSAAVLNAIEGFNSTIFAYGQTGSGKTFTLTGGPEKYSDRGIIPRSISMLFSEFRKRTDMNFKMFVSYLEIYNEQGYDLLDSSQESKSLENLPRVSILEDEHGNYHLKNLSMHTAESEEDALNLLFLGDTNRAIAETPMNMASSRSHCIFTISLESRSSGSDKIRRSKLHLVDLAGSERVAKTNSSGSVLTEAKYINTSLFFLEMVIVALHEKATAGRTHVPYRNSMMTSVLRDSLGGNCKTVMIATINPEASHTEESLSTCRFAQRVSLIKNRATINEEMDPGQVIKRLKSEVLALREEISFLKGETGEGNELTSGEMDELRAQCRNYCDDANSALSIGSLSMTRIKCAFQCLKELVIAGRSTVSAGSSVVESEPPQRDGDNFLLLQQIENLKSLLIQRDNEINILVNMVKKGKSVDQERVTTPQMKDVSQSSNRPDEKLPSRPRVVAEQSAKKDIIIKKHLFGIPPPSDATIFDDASASFEWFRERSSLNSSIEDNKELLKAKIGEAKVVGERANQCRNTIAYLKGSIESIRKESLGRALQQLSSGEDTLDESPEEVTYRRAIEQEKLIYKDSFDKLKSLKPEIEHIRKILERCRINLQSQFDQWYSTLHGRAAATVLDFTNAEEKSVPVRSGPSESLNDTVEEDISAFFQAKQEYLRRKQTTNDGFSNKNS